MDVLVPRVEIDGLSGRSLERQRERERVKRR